LTRSEGTAPLMSPAPTIHSSNVTKTQMAWDPTDDSGCLDQVGWTKRME